MPTKPPAPAAPVKKPYRGKKPGMDDSTYLWIGFGAVVLLLTKGVYSKFPGWWETNGAAAVAAWAPVLVMVGVVAVGLGVCGCVYWARNAGLWRWQRICRERFEAVKLDGTVKVHALGGDGLPAAVSVVCGKGAHPSKANLTQIVDVLGLPVFGVEPTVKQRVSGDGRSVVDLGRPVERDRLTVDLEKVAKEALPAVNELKVTEMDGGRPSKIVISHDASFRALTADVMAEALERALTDKLGWKAHTYRMVWDPMADVVVLERWQDPLATVTGALPYQPVDKVDLSALPVGLKDDGSLFTVDLTGGRHTLVAGSTGSGKSSLVQGIIRAVAPAVHAGWIALRGLDPKGGAELGQVRALMTDLAAGPVMSVGKSAQFTPPDDADMLLAEHARQLDMLQRAGRDVLERAYRLGAEGKRELGSPTVKDPWVLVFVDEVALMTAYLGSRADKEAAQTAIAAIVTQGRAWGFTLIALLQDPRMKTLEIRNLFPVKIGLRLDRKSEVSMVLGDGAAENGARCDRINPATPGIGFKLEDGNPVPVRFRAAYVNDRGIRDMCERFPAPEFPEAPPVAVQAPAVKPKAPGGTGKAKVGAVLAGDVVGDTPVYPDQLERGDRIMISHEGALRDVKVTGVTGDDPYLIGWVSDGVEGVSEVDGSDPVRKLLTRP